MTTDRQVVIKISLHRFPRACYIEAHVGKLLFSAVFVLLLGSKKCIDNISEV